MLLMTPTLLQLNNLGTSVQRAPPNRKKQDRWPTNLGIWWLLIIMRWWQGCRTPAKEKDVHFKLASAEDLTPIITYSKGRRDVKHHFIHLSRHPSVHPSISYTHTHIYIYILGCWDNWCVRHTQNKMPLGLSFQTSKVSKVSTCV